MKAIEMYICCILLLLWHKNIFFPILCEKYLDSYLHFIHINFLFVYKNDLAYEVIEQSIHKLHKKVPLLWLWFVRQQVLICPSEIQNDSKYQKTSGPIEKAGNTFRKSASQPEITHLWWWAHSWPQTARMARWSHLMLLREHVWSHLHEYWLIWKVLMFFWPTFSCDKW